MIDLNKEAKNLADNESLFRDGLLTLCNKKLFIKGAIAGANSKYVKQQILQAQIDVLNSLDTKLQSKYKILTNMQQECLGKMKEGLLAYKKSGIRLAKEEIRRYLKEFQDELKQLQDE